MDDHSTQKEYIRRHSIPLNREQLKLYYVIRKNLDKIFKIDLIIGHLKMKKKISDTYDHAKFRNL